MSQDVAASGCRLQVVRGSLFYRWFCACGDESINLSSPARCREDFDRHLRESGGKGES